jgi:hypothetical protein
MRAVSKLALMTLLLVVVVSTPAALAVDYVTAVIKCPMSTYFKLEWKDAIGSDPTFKNIVPVNRPQQHFQSMDRQGQTIKCHYSQGGVYAYTVERSIRSCTQPSPHVMECQVQNK